MNVSEQEIERAVELAWKVPGLYRKGEARFLYRLARRRGEFVELGCWMGRSTAILLQAARVWGASVTSVDPFVVLPTQGTQASAERWRANLQRVGLTPPPLLEMRSDEAAKAYRGHEIALLFIDADHSKAGVARDLHDWARKVKVGGVVALHDMFYPSVTGVCQAVAAWWSRERDVIREPKWELVGLHDFTIAFRRVG